MLVAVATVPIFSVILGFFFPAKRLSPGTWAIIGIVFFGVVFSVIGDIDTAEFLNLYTFLVGLLGLFVAISLAENL